MAAEAVRVVTYDPCWPALYEEERARIEAAAGARICGIEHVGSTAVPGLAAKPILDIMVGVRNLEDARRCIAPLEALGYECRGEAGVPGRLFLRKFAKGSRTHHLHLVEFGGREWERRLLFRDYLRRHPAVAREYARLKRRLAQRHRNDRDAYTEAKADFISGVVERARQG